LVIDKMSVLLDRWRRKHIVLFSLIIGLSTLSFAWGTWRLMDIYLFPNSPEIAAWSAIFLGFFILSITGFVSKELI